MFKGERIKVLLEEKNVTKKSLADAVNISTLGLDGIIAGSNVRAGNLEKIADFFKLPIDYFFDREVELNPVEPVPKKEVSEEKNLSLEAENALLKKSLKKKKELSRFYWVKKCSKNCSKKRLEQKN